MNDWSAINLAFSKQAIHFDADDLSNPILQSWRKQIYAHVDSFLKPGDQILELNAGTGIDAIHFAKQGHAVLATDLSTGMIGEIEKKIRLHPALPLTCKQISFEALEELGEARFDYVFSNFGGLNCLRDLSTVTRNLADHLHPGAYLTWVIMPPFCPWELLWIFKGKWNDALRRFSSAGTNAHLEGEYFQTYYHSLTHIKTALGPDFHLIKTEGLGIFSAPPSASRFSKAFPWFHHQLQNMDKSLGDFYPFNRWGDHIIVTFQYRVK